ncbi:MAG TPA: DoxX family protein [Acetobacteraceae bacterium]|nr:DoxX family protein [Acetobacteraceae bacterium]
MPWVILLSRVLMAAIFIQSGYGKATHPSATMGMLEHYNLPLPGLAYAVSLLVEVGAGIAFLLGWKGQAAALILAIWSVATAFVAHYHPGDTGQMINFMKNLCMAGGFLQVAVYGPGAFSLDRK